MQADDLAAPSQSHRMVIDNCAAEDKSRAAFSPFQSFGRTEKGRLCRPPYAVWSCPSTRGGASRHLGKGAGSFRVRGGSFVWRCAIADRHPA